MLLIIRKVFVSNLDKFWSRGSVDARFTQILADQLANKCIMMKLFDSRKDAYIKTIRPVYILSLSDSALPIFSTKLFACTIYLNSEEILGF